MTKQYLPPFTPAAKLTASLASLDRSDASKLTASLASLDRSDASKPTASLASLDRSDACCEPLVHEPLSPGQAGTLAPMFKALGDPVRLRLLSMIASHTGGEVCVCDLTGRFNLTGPTISHHLRVLREAGLIDCQRRGTWVFYWLQPGVLDTLAAILDPERLRAAATGAPA